MNIYIPVLNIHQTVFYNCNTVSACRLFVLIFKDKVAGKLCMWHCLNGQQYITNILVLYRISSILVKPEFWCIVFYTYMLNIYNYL